MLMLHFEIRRETSHNEDKTVNENYVKPSDHRYELDKRK